jgi:two-component system chemotaxis response regulator CheY
MLKSILIIDDSRIARKMLNYCIKKYKEFNVFEAVDGFVGIEKYKELNPDIVFMDLTMPVLNGYEATKEIIKFDKNAIILVLTADIQPKSVDKIINMGAFSVIEKPAKPEIIRETLVKAEKILDASL